MTVFVTPTRKNVSSLLGCKLLSLAAPRILTAAQFYSKGRHKTKQKKSRVELDVQNC